MDPTLIVTGLIAVVTPVVIAGIKALVAKIPALEAKIPKFLIPAFAPLVGFLLNLLPALVGLVPVGTVGSLIAGALGVWVREIVDQVKKVLNISPTPTTPVK